MANQSFYELNVSYKGRHLFATAERSATTETTAIMLLTILKERFPAEKGYAVTCTYWETTGHKFEHDV